MSQFTPIVKLELNSHFLQEERTLFNGLLTILMNVSYIACNYLYGLLYNYSFDEFLEPLSFLQSVLPFAINCALFLFWIFALHFVSFKTKELNK